MQSLDEIKNWLKQDNQPLRSNVGDFKKKKGLSVLFDGADGKSKLTAAKMLGKEFGKEVHHVDLSKAVSKYIGETEKNLTVLFKEAAEKDWILFFDEADALFGKRTDIKDAHDRYANTEVNYLLQKIESYSGLVIVALHLRQNIDSAFVRRFHAVIHFPIN